MRKFKFKGRRASPKQAGSKIHVKQFIIIVMCISVLSFFYLELQVRPKIFSLSEIKAKSMATEAINAAVLEEIERANIKYTDLVDLEYKEDKSIGGLSTDIVNVNKLKSSITLCAQKKISTLSKKEISFASGDLSGLSLLSGRGPKINVKLNYTSSIETDFENHFETAGMNQTLHTLDVKITANIIVRSRNMEESIKIETTVPVAETIIVGEIPSLYLGRNQLTGTE